MKGAWRNLAQESEMMRTFARDSSTFKKVDKWTRNLIPVDTSNVHSTLRRGKILENRERKEEK